MNLKHLFFFKRTAELQSITKAALELRIAQPALSRIIRDLEDEFGSPLFNRCNHRIYLNENGEILLRYVLQIEDRIHTLNNDLLKDSHDSSEKITILLRSTPAMLPELLQQFLIKNPSAKLDLITYNRSIHEQKLKYDFSILSSIKRASSSDSKILLFTEELVLAVPKGHYLCNKEIAFGDIKDESFICLPADNQYFHEFNGLCQKNGFTPNIVLETTDYFTIATLIQSGHGLAVVPKYSWGLLQKPGIELLNFSSPTIRNNVFLEITKQNSSSRICDRFVSFAQSYFSSLNQRS